MDDLRILHTLPFVKFGVINKGKTRVFSLAKNLAPDIKDLKILHGALCDYIVLL